MTQKIMRSISGILLACSLLLGSLTASAQEFVWAPEFPVGAQLAEIAAQDQNGELLQFEDLVGDSGMLFMLSRSFDW